MIDIEEKINNEIIHLRKKCKKYNYIFIILILFSWLTVMLIDLLNFIKIFPIILFIAAVTIMIYKIEYRNKTFNSIKQELFSEVLSNLIENDTIIYDKKGMAEEEFINSEIYKYYDNYYTSDILKSSKDNFCIANVTTSKKEGKKSTTVFRGVFGYAKTEEFFENEIIIKPDVENKFASNVSNMYNKFTGNGSNIIRLENNEFEKYFEVFSSNQIKARQIITLDYMEKLLNIKKEINAIIKIIYKGNRKYVAIWYDRILDEDEILREGIKIKSIKEKISKLINTILEC